MFDLGGDDDDDGLGQICKDKDEAEVWVVGLKALITRVKVSKWKTTIKPEITSAECPTPRARRVSPFVTIIVSKHQHQHQHQHIFIYIYILYESDHNHIYRIKLLNPLLRTLHKLG